ncbi:RNA methyltransferase, partial [Salinimicrobium sp. CDJ15-91]|nr:RNA methyltransferase [Salinimicrobium oceani]
MQKFVSSLQNPAVKRILLLQEKARARRKENAFVVEGIREISLALKGGFKLKEFFFNTELFPAEKIKDLVPFP